MTRRPARLLLPALLVVLAGCGGSETDETADAAPVCAAPVVAAPVDDAAAHDGARTAGGADATGLPRPVDVRDDRELRAVTSDQADLVQRLHDAESKGAQERAPAPEHASEPAAEHGGRHEGEPKGEYEGEASVAAHAGAQPVPVRVLALSSAPATPAEPAGDAETQGADATGTPAVACAPGADAALGEPAEAERDAESPPAATDSGH